MDPQPPPEFYLETESGYQPLTEIYRVSQIPVLSVGDTFKVKVVPRDISMAGSRAVQKVEPRNGYLDPPDAPARMRQKNDGAHDQRMVKHDLYVTPTRRPSDRSQYELMKAPLAGKMIMARDGFVSTQRVPPVTPQNSTSIVKINDGEKSTQQLVPATPTQQRMPGRPVPPSGQYPDHNKKIYCTYWLRTGDCDYKQQGCLYKHEMPDLKTLKSIGINKIPEWWMEELRKGKNAPQYRQVVKQDDTSVLGADKENVVSPVPKSPQPVDKPEHLRVLQTTPGWRETITIPRTVSATPLGASAARLEVLSPNSQKEKFTDARYQPLAPVRPPPKGNHALDMSVVQNDKPAFRMPIMPIPQHPQQTQMMAGRALPGLSHRPNPNVLLGLGSSRHATPLEASETTPAPSENKSSQFTTVRKYGESSTGRVAPPKSFQRK